MTRIWHGHGGGIDGRTDQGSRSLILAAPAGTMWIQVRTMDGKVAHTVDSLSRLTKVEELRKKIQFKKKKKKNLILSSLLLSCYFL